MKVLGISGLENSVVFKQAHWPGLEECEYRIAQGMDAAAALLIDGILIAAAEEERFTGMKHTGDFPVHAIRFCLAEAGISIDAVDEGTLAVWWQDLLGVEHVGLDDDLFALGGRSLVGVRLFAKIKKTWQVDLELAVLFEARTVRKLAEVVRKSKLPATSEPKAWSTLVPIQPNGSRTPLFCVHAVGGDVIFYEQLARALGSNQPFYAFQSPLVSQTDIRQTSIEELASTYVKAMQSFFPQGPYLIGGASFGGLVAFEMARQLYAQGAEPRLLVLFDTAIPGNEQRVDAKERAAGFLAGLRRQGTAYLKKKTAVKRVYWGDNLLRQFRLLACASHRLVRRQLPVHLHYFQMEEAHKQALTRYTFHPYGWQDDAHAGSGSRS